jgi:hypothetical protein
MQVATKSLTGIWTAPVTISPNGQSIGEGTLDVAQSSAAVAAWVVGDGPVDRIAAAVRTAAGTWSTAKLLSPADLRARRVAAAITPSGAATVGWQRVEAEDEDLGVTRSAVVVSSSVSGGEWSTATQLSPTGPNRDDGSVDLAADPTETTTAVWHGDGGRILSAARSSGGTWSAPVVISGANLRNAFPSIAADDHGEVTAIWQRSHSGYSWVTTASLVNGGSPGPGPTPTPDPTPIETPQPQPPVQVPVPPALPRTPVPAPAIRLSAKLSATKIRRGKRLTIRVTNVPNKARLIVSWKPKRGNVVKKTVTVSKNRAQVLAPKKKGRYRVTVNYKGRALVKGRTVVVR